MAFFKNLPADAGVRHILAMSPQAGRALVEFHSAVLRSESELSPKDKELIAAYVSGLNACQYCYGVHAQTAQAFGIPEGLLEQLLQSIKTQAGKSVVVDVSAPWCPTCKAQKPIIDDLAKQPAYKDVTILTVDFDSEKNILKQYKVNMQSTLIGFKAGKETARSVGDSTPSGIESIFKKAVN